MPVESTTATRWDALHRDPRHQLTYPSEHVVRWLAGLPIREGNAIDIGCGWFRHMRLLVDQGFSTIGVDIASRCYGVSCYNPQTRISERTCIADMRALPFADDYFDLALAYGVFYYGSRDDMKQAVAEMYRVMRPGGHGFVKTRTVHDWRAGGIPEGEPEHGMEMTFLAQDDIARVYAAFDTVTFETTATSTHERQRWNCDYLIQVTK